MTTSEPERERPQSTEAQPMPLTLAPGIEAPQSSVILAAIRPTLGGKLAIAAPAIGFGPGRYAVAVRRTEPGAEHGYTVHAVVVEARDSAQDPNTWTVVATQEVHAWSAPWLDEPEAGRVPTTMVADDFDDDGEAELLVRVALETMCPGGGPNEITHMTITDFSPSPRIVLRTELRHSLMESAETKATVVHEDLDGDGHRDVRIRYVTRSEPDPDETAENRWLWVAGEDAWVREPARAEAELPGYERWGCDW